MAGFLAVLETVSYAIADSSVVSQPQPCHCLLPFSYCVGGICYLSIGYPIHQACCGVFGGSFEGF